MSSPEIEQFHDPEPEPAPKGAAASQEVKREIVEFVKMIAWFLVVFFVVKTYIVEGYEVQGPSMIPTLQDRERILVFKLPHILSQYKLFSGIEALKPEDIVVFDSPEPNKRYVKRVIAKGPPKLPGNTVVAEPQGAEGADQRSDANGSVSVTYDRGNVYVNNKRLSEDYLQPARRGVNDMHSEVRLNPGGYYVMGDNRNVSKDSRSFGQIDDGRLIGKAVLCFWPPSQIRLLR